MIALWIVGAILFFSWLAIIFVGAPYVPTKRRDLEGILKIAALKKDDIIVDLGSGDGRLLVEAARAGHRSVGYELNPFLVVLTWWRLRPFQPLGDVRMVDFWQTPLPEGTKAVFVFLAAPFMPRLEKWLQQEADHLGTRLTLISYGFEIPGRSPSEKRGSLVVYHFTPAK